MWCYGTETIDMNPTPPKSQYGFNGNGKTQGQFYLERPPGPDMLKKGFLPLVFTARKYRIVDDEEHHQRMFKTVIAIYQGRTCRCHDER